MQVVVEVQFTDLACVDPKRKFVLAVPGTSPAPVTVTVVPPAVDAVFGLAFVTVGVNL
jgi:hypothetical protein